MNSRNIKANIHRVFNEWVESIKDPEVKELVKDNSLVCGGAITSLLQGEKPKDFDIYFTNLKTTVKVAQYYYRALEAEGKIVHKVGGKAITFISVGDQNFPIKENLTDYFFQNMEASKPRVKFFIRSAGIMSDEPIETYQYFEQINNPNNVDVENFVDAVTQAIEDDKSKDKPKFRPVFCSTNAITLSDKIQIILRFYGDPHEIFENFDFVHTKNYWRASSGHLELNPAALEAIINKQLVFQGSKYPLASMFRIRKFLSRGWYINAADMLKIAYQISELNLSDITVLEDQLIGVDAAYFTMLVKHVKEEMAKDPTLNMGFHYLSTILEEVF